jgi:ribosomal protein S18 acetylase RimI-like enzyme
MERPSAAASSGWPRSVSAGLSFRPATDADLGFLAALYASTRLQELAQTGWPEPAIRDFLGQQFAAQHAHYMRHYPGAEWLVVEHQAAAIGRLYFVHWPRECRIIDIAFMPQARSRGFGSAVLGDLIDQAGEKPVSTHVERMNPALSLYRRLGFEIAEYKGVYLLLERRP